MVKNRFVGLPEGGRAVFLYDESRRKKVRQVLWGDYLHVSKELGEWLEVTWSPKKNPQKLYIPTADTSETRPLEMVFVDVGQGDGAVLITPERNQRERVIVIDAGEGPNMASFLKRRFGMYQTGFQFHAAVISHPDEDHYRGFKPIFEEEGVGFDVVYHNGLIEQPKGADFERLGGLTPKKYKRNGPRQYLKVLAEDTPAVEEAFSDPDAVKRKPFALTMHAAIQNPNIDTFTMLSTEHGISENGKTYMPDFAPTDDRGYTIRVLSPVVEFDNNGAMQLRKLGSYGETKNGHSVVLQLSIGGFKVLFGGDLNDKAEPWLLAHYSGLDEIPDKGTKEFADMSTDAAHAFRSDVFKVCHHGSEKVTDEFLASVNPAAFIISSGDEGGHVHPRPDLLGRLGKFGRGKAPVLLSTELQRSTREAEDAKTIKRLTSAANNLANDGNPEKLKELTDGIALLGRTNVTVWGSIYVKTDGHRLITAFKKETNSKTDRWFYFEYTLENGELVLAGAEH